METIKDLQHATVPLSSGGKVVVLNTGAIIGPEAEAMLQALHSRSVGGIDAHLRVLADKGPEKFMETYYVGYGHKSIGDCGTATIFVEGVSMLVAKAIQDHPLYSGQEASTRYIDFSKQRFINPCVDEHTYALGEKILEDLRSLYLEALDTMIPVLTKRHPNEADESKVRYEKAIKARAFDICRSLLPAGATTNLAWHGNLRQMRDKLLYLRFHPLQEVREIAEAIEDAMCEAFPSSFTKKRYEDTDAYVAEIMRLNYLFVDKTCPDFMLYRDDINPALLREHVRELSLRPNRETELPWYVAECGTVQFRFLLDFGSYRDIQRHRAVTQRMPLVARYHGFEPWYLKQMPEELQVKVAATLDVLDMNIKNLCLSPEEEQYFTAMGYRLPNRLTGNLAALVYLAERRARTDVHPTLQKRAHQMASALNELFGNFGLAVHTDKEVGRFDIVRGDHDIVAKT